MDNNLFKSLTFTNEFSVEDWNSLLNTTLRVYFRTQEVFDGNKEVLRTELFNYFKFHKNEVLFSLFVETFRELQLAIEDNKVLAIKELAKDFYEVSDTDLKWMTNFLTHPEHSKFSEHDKIYFYFKVIDDIVEGCFKPRFTLFYRFVLYNINKTYSDTSKSDFGKLINEFPVSKVARYNLYLKDPIFGIHINQWRNIAAHKSFSIQKDNITVSYGKKSIKTENISYDGFYKTLDWIINVYTVLRFSEVLIDLNFIEDIVKELGGTNKIKIRFESSLVHLVSNLQIVGFEFVKSEEENDVFSITLKKKANDELKSSLIHASQCLDKLACSVYDDEFTKDKFKCVRVYVVDLELSQTMSATVSIEIALKKVYRKLTQKEYISNITFSI